MPTVRVAAQITPICPVAGLPKVDPISAPNGGDVRASDFPVLITLCEMP